MTNGEKIKGLYSLKEYLVENPIELEGHKSLPITLIDYAIEALEQEPTTKNDLGVDCVSRKAVDSLVWKYLRKETDDNIAFYEHFLDLPSVTPQEPQTFKWCETCKEYDQEKHCCHRWSKVIRDTVEEMKQEYIEREVLDKIRAEIIELRSKQNVGVLECLEIIDKYKTETEE